MGSLDERSRTWNILAESAEQQRAAHEVRETWHLTRLQRWLSWLATNRNDARDASKEGIQASSALVRRLRGIAGQVDGHGVSIMCGGFAQMQYGHLLDMCVTCVITVHN